jgi:hypothetical protein
MENSVDSFDLGATLSAFLNKPCYRRNRKILFSNVGKIKSLFYFTNNDFVSTKDLMSLSLSNSNEAVWQTLAKNSVDYFNLDSASANRSKFPSVRKES